MKDKEPFSLNQVYGRNIKELDNTLKRVAWLLIKHKQLRNTDIALIYFYWKYVNKFDGRLSLDKLKELTNPETIRRCRAKLQSPIEKGGYGLLPPTDPHIRKARKIKEEAYRDWVTSERSNTQTLLRDGWT